MTVSPDELVERVNANDVEGVRRALAEEPSLAKARVLGEIASTALHCAAHRGFPDVVTALLAAGADVRAGEAGSGLTPLHWAAEGGHAGIARTLLASGADREARDAWYGLTPLGWATVVVWAPVFHEDRPATAAALRSAGARQDAFTALAMDDAEEIRALALRDPAALTRPLGFAADGARPLHVAVLLKKPDMVRLLLDLGAPPEPRTDTGLTPLALSIGHEATRVLLESRGARDEISSAVVRGDAGAVAAGLSDAGRDPELSTRLLFAAARLGRAEPLALLLRHGADANTRMRQLLREVPTLVTPLHVAAMHGRHGAARALIEGGAAPSPGAEDGTPTPLHLAAGDGHVETVRVLLEGGADRESRDKSFGAKPLGWAEFGGHEEAAALLRAEPGGGGRVSGA